MRRVFSRLVVPVVLLGLLGGCVSHDRGYGHGPVYRHVHGPAYGPVYGPVHGHGYGPLYSPVYGPGVEHYRAGHPTGYRIEQREIRVPVQRHYEPRRAPSYRPPNALNPPVRRPERPVFAPGYRSDERHQRPRGEQRPRHQRGDRDERRGGHWQGSPRPPQDGGGRPGRGEHRGHR